MKSYNEMAKDVLRRIEEHNTQQKRKRKAAARIAIPAGCLCLAALLGIGLWKSDFFKAAPTAGLDGSTLTDEKDGMLWGDNYGKGQEPPPDGVTDATSSEADSADKETVKQLCYVNQIKSITNSDIAGPDPSKHYCENWDDDRMTAYLGIDLSAINQAFKLDASNHTVWFQNDGKLVKDYAIFAYSNEKIKFELSASKTEAPRDCIVIPKEDLKATSIGTDNGTVTVNFYGTAGSDTENFPETQKKMIADFEEGGVYYRVKAENISVYDFYKIVSVIIDS